ncbi:MAG TPA: ABC transporter ATP-binding protein, partial [Acidimicrobiales bacterium]|nr:ABC transporter ATP-binding protein [Acidimicrobiales bacterium]
AGEPADGPTAAPGPGAEDPVLELREVEAGYGPFRALFGVDLVVPPAGAVALVGANGAGKTTVARVATGLVRPTAGSVHVAGRDLTDHRTFRFARAGVLHVAEGRSVFAPLTVEENLLVTRRSRAERAVALERAYEVFPVLGKRRRQQAGTLSGGEQRMLSLATAIVEEPVVVVADELALGLAPSVVDVVYGHLAAVRATGTALLLIEQKVHHTLEVCDHVVVLRRGAVDWSGPTADAGDVVAGVLGAAV